MAGKLSQITSWMLTSLNYPIQVIIVHDIADLITGAELRELIRYNKLFNVIFIEGKYRSPGLARNAGIERATGDWYAFWDSDDNPFIENVMLALMETSFDDEIVIGKFNIRNYLKDSVRSDSIITTSFKSIAMNPGVWRMVFRSRIVHEVRFTNLRSGEDQVFLSQINFVEKNLKYDPKVFYEYGIEQDSQLTSSIQSLRDLPFASELILKNAIKDTGDMLFFDLILMIRQQITLLRRGSFSLKLQAIYFIIIFIKNFKFSMLAPTIKALFFVITNLRKSRIK
jgi:hypothetical protein